MRIRLLCLLLYIGKKILSRCFIGDMFSSQLLVYGIFTCLHRLQSLYFYISFSRTLVPCLLCSLKAS